MLVVSCDYFGEAMDQLSEQANIHEARSPAIWGLQGQHQQGRKALA